MCYSTPIVARKPLRLLWASSLRRDCKSRSFEANNKFHYVHEHRGVVRFPSMPYEITHRSLSLIPLPLRAFTVLSFPDGTSPLLGSCLGSRSTGARAGRQSATITWYANTPRLSLCPSLRTRPLPLLERLVALRALSRGRAWAHSSSLSEQAQGQIDVRNLECHGSHRVVPALN